jgi:hypothetical protein
MDGSTPIIHHLDHDHSNDDPANLAVAHNSCHARYHVTRSRLWEASKTPEAIAKRARSLRTSAKHAAGRARTAEALRGRTLSPEQREACRAGVVKRPRFSCILCRQEFDVTRVGRHTSSCRRRQERRAALLKRTCAWCGRLLGSVDPRQRFCDDRCRHRVQDRRWPR